MTADKSGVPLAFRDEQVRDLIVAINAHHGTSFRLSGRYGGGDGPGAYQLASRDGRRQVLKCSRGDDAAPVERASTATGFLRERGYPAPVYVAVGCADGVVYEVQTELDGSHLSGIGMREHHLEQLLALNRLQADGPPLDTPEWPAPVVDPVLHGRHGFCLIETMLEYSSATAALLFELQGIVRADAPHVPTDRRDVVHFDFHTSNILATLDRITGVIDWQAPHTGDRAFDLVCLTWQERVWWSRILPGLVERSGAPAVRVYAAHLIHRTVEWMTRFHRHRVDPSIRAAREILDALVDF